VKGFDRLTHEPGVMGGRICIRGMRITVDVIIAELEAGRDADEILADYPYLEREDVEQAQRFAAWVGTARETDLSPP
jgi:uncharacterized protein (DUF433 family)